MNKVGSYLAVSFAGLLFFGCNFRQLEVITDEEATFDGIAEISVAGGALEVRYVGVEGVEEVTLTAYLESNDPISEGIVYHKRGDRLEVMLPESDSPFSFWTGRTKGYVHLSGPKDIKLDLKGSSGVLDIAHIRGDIFDFSISSGKMELTDVTCNALKLACSSGKLEASGISGAVDLRLSSGLAVLEDVEGNVQFKGSSGSVSIQDINGRVAGSMSSGKASLNQVTELGELSLASGMLTAERAGLGAETSLSVSSGYMRVTTNASLADFNYDFSVGSGHLTIGEEGYTDDIHRDNGRVHTITGKVQSGKLELVSR
ncbi:DUF4097 family beta strand repeat-containing protein [Lunatimonas salinarum]|uniref:DUF4097 family beta strand repeat-containing protein n=1 Tax=Lunatimonas salinarum TaxID=1774590 RepID=UPI001AE0AD85|nr:DUF4097 family beta strand repeat-containing protein [Lunatimonas salinarum]